MNNFSIQLFSVLVLATIPLTAYWTLREYLNAETLGSRVIRSALFVSGFLFLYSVFSLSGILIGVPLGSHGPTRFNAMWLLGFRGGNILRFALFWVGVFPLLLRRGELSIPVLVFMLVPSLFLAGFFFRGGAAYSPGHPFRVFDTSFNQLNMRLLGLIIGRSGGTTWRAIIFGFTGISLLPYTSLTDSKPLKTAVYFPSLSLIARWWTRICDGDLPVKFLCNMQAALIVNLPLLLVFLLLAFLKRFQSER